MFSQNAFEVLCNPYLCKELLRVLLNLHWGGVAGDHDGLGGGDGQCGLHHVEHGRRLLLHWRHGHGL